MDSNTATDYVDIVVEYLRECGALSENAYGKLTANQLEEMANKIIERSNE